MTAIYITYWISLAVLWGVFISRFIYQKGYDKREQEFQDNPVQWIADGEKAVFVTRFEGKVKVKIQKNDLVILEVMK